MKSVILTTMRKRDAAPSRASLFLLGAGSNVAAFLVYFVAAVAVSTLWISAALASDQRPLSVAVLTDGDSPITTEISSALRAQVTALSTGSSPVTFPNQFQRKGAWTRESVSREFRALLRDDAVDVVIALGVIASDLASELDPDKPVLAPFVIDPSLQGFPISVDGTSGVRNLHYLANNRDIESEISRFSRSTGSTRIALVAEQGVAEAMPLSTSEIQDRVARLGIQIRTIAASDDVEATVADIPNDVDAVFILPLFRLTVEQQKLLIDNINERGLPSFAAVGKSLVDSGALMGTALVPSLERTARQLALDINDIRLGRHPGSIKVRFDTDDTLFLNMRTARSIGFSPPFSLLYEADLLNEIDEAGQKLTFADVIHEALTRNLQLAIANQDLLSAKQSTRIARSELLPQLSVSANEQALERSLAGVGADRTSTASIGLSQAIFSESARASLSVAKNLESAETASRDSVRLDTIQQAASTFLDILVAETQLTIQRDNLKLTRANLQRAKFRFESGAADRSETYRFETEIANNRQEVANAEAQLLQIRNELNRLLRRPTERPFQLTSPALSDFRIFADSRLDDSVTNPRKADQLRGFLAKEALENAPELRAIDNRIYAQERTLLAAKRARFVPEVALTGEFSEVLNQSGSLMEQDQVEGWSVGINFTLPIFQGRRLDAEQQQANVELRRLMLQKQQLADNIESGARSAVMQASASKRNIQFASDAAEASSKTLALVIDAYTTGTATDVDVIDAQSAALVAQLSFANANYQFLLDLIDVQREAGFFAFFVDQAFQDDWFKRFESFTHAED